MQAGSLNRLVEIQQQGEAKDETGQPIPGWIKYADAWANIKTVSGRQYVTSGSERSEVTTSIKIRYRTDITAQMRVAYKGTIYTIAAVLPDEADRDCLYLACSTGVRNA